jgi:hypothetical protein
VSGIHPDDEGKAEASVVFHPLSRLPCSLPQESPYGKFRPIRWAVKGFYYSFLHTGRAGRSTIGMIDVCKAKRVLVLRYLTYLRYLLK